MKFLLLNLLLLSLMSSTAIAEESFNLPPLKEECSVRYSELTEPCPVKTEKELKKEYKSNVSTAVTEENIGNYRFKLLNTPSDFVKLFKLQASIDEDNKSFLSKTWDFVKGEPSDDALVLGMFSYHMSEKADEYNESNKILGVEYKGYTVGTFNNSYHRQTYYAGITRELWDYKKGKVKLDFKYKLIGMHGYHNKYPDLLGITPLIAPIFGVTFKNVGVDFIVMPADRCTFSANFRLNMPGFN